MLVHRLNPLPRHCEPIHCLRRACRCRFIAETYNSSLCHRNSKLIHCSYWLLLANAARLNAPLCHCPSLLRPRIVLHRRSIAIQCLSTALRFSAKAVRYIAIAMRCSVIPLQVSAKLVGAEPEPCSSLHSHANALPCGAMPSRFCTLPLLILATPPPRSSDPLRFPSDPCDSTAFHDSSSAVPAQLCLRSSLPVRSRLRCCHAKQIFTYAQSLPIRSDRDRHSATVPSRYTVRMRANR